MSEPRKNGNEVPQRSDVFVSVVAVLDSSLKDGAAFVRDLHTHVSPRYTNYEIILVDNGFAPDRFAEVRELLDTLPCIRILRLSRHFAVDTAFFAGLEAAIGDYVVVMSPAFDPVEVVSEVVALNRAGNDVVQGISTAPLGGGPVGKLGRNAFYSYNRRFLGVDIPKRSTYLTGLTRRAVNSLTNTARKQRYLRHLIRHVGYRMTDFPYTPELGAARRRTMKQGTLDAVEMISSYSTHPLRVVTILSVVAGFLNLVYAVYVVIVNLLRQDVAEGWTTTSLQLSLMFFLICIVLAVQAEYIGRVLTESRGEPSYFVMEELESETLIADLERRNVSR